MAAGNSIRINTDEVSQVATNIEQINKKLFETLENGMQEIEKLGNTWSGEAYQETAASFGAFATKYFQTYKDVIDQYVSFLRKNVEQGYFDTETKNTSLAESFK